MRKNGRKSSAWTCGLTVSGIMVTGSAFAGSALPGVASVALASGGFGAGTEVDAAEFAIFTEDSACVR
jgi:hypothetical protein